MWDAFISDAALPQDPLWVAERPPWRDELLRVYAEEFSSPGALLLDPFAGHPALLRVAQSVGRRVLASNFDPLPLLQIRLSLSPPSPRALDTIVSRLADTPKAGKPLSRHLDDLYRIYCPACQRVLSADYIVWDEEVPVEKGFHCSHCGEKGPAPITPQDLDIQIAAEEKGATYWRLRQRLASPEDEEVGERAAELLALYTPRNRYALGELMLQAETLFLPKEEAALEAIRGLCLACLQRCHSLHGDARQTCLPRSLHRPDRFVERNVWRTFETAYRTLRSWPPAPPITWAASLPALLEPTPGPGFGSALTLQRTSRMLTEALQYQPRLTFICTDPPRPGPAAYALAFLWSGWLFGREATLPLRPLLRRRSVDWEWYSEVMFGVFKALRRLLADGGRLLLAFTAEEERLLPALLLAAARAELALDHSVYQLQGEGVRGERMAYRLLFRCRPRPAHVPSESEEEVKRWAEERAPAFQEQGAKTAQAALQARGEPAFPPWLRASIVTRWSSAGLLPAVPSRSWSFRPLAWLMRQVNAVAPPEGPAPGGLRWLAPDAELDGKPALGACWWLADPSAAVEPLSERVELATADLLQQTLTWPQGELHDALCRRFRGLLTPERPLLEACIASYGQELSPGYWQLRPEDWPQARVEARRQMVRLLVQSGQRLGFDVWLAEEEREGDKGEVTLSPPLLVAPSPLRVVWHEGGAPAHGFALSDTAALTPWLEPPPPALADVPRYIVVPGGRSGLLAFKLRCCPAWRHRLEAHGWMFVKQRQLRRLAEADDLDRAGWRARLGLDPIVERAEEQLALFGTTDLTDHTEVDSW